MNSKSSADLPPDCIEHVLKYLSSEDVKLFGLTCKRFKRIANSVLKRRITKILISNGGSKTVSAEQVSDSGILTIESTIDSIHSKYEPIGDYFTKARDCFSAHINATTIVGGGWDSSNKALKEVFVFESNCYKEIQSLNVARASSSSVVLSSPHSSTNFRNQENLLIVTGGFDTLPYRMYDTIEYLIVNNSLKSNAFKISLSKLPSKVLRHQLNILNNKVILTGGYNVEGKSTNKVWEGTVSYQPELCIEWKSLPSMLEIRYDHVSVVFEDKLYCLGGFDGENALKSVECFSFSTNKWQRCPDLHCTIFQAKGVFNNLSREFYITGGKRDGKISSKVSLFTPSSGMSDIEGNVGITRRGHVAVLL